MWPFKSKEERVAELNEEISKLQAIVEGTRYSSKMTVAEAEKRLEELTTELAKID